MSTVTNNYYFGTGGNDLPLLIDASTILNVVVGSHYVFTGTMPSIWTLPPASAHAGETLPVTNQTVITNLTMATTGGLPEIWVWGGTTPGTNVVPNSTIYFKSNGTYWYCT